MDSNPRSPVGSVRLWAVVVLICAIWSPGPKVPDEDRGRHFVAYAGSAAITMAGYGPARPASCQMGDKARAGDAVQSPSSADTGHADGALLDLLKMEEIGADEWPATSAT